ncbi:MerR family transcriptional regulator [Naasia sp. SYSU D00948]|uniref:MerR family transcriptional regulator n=1 Tax=Naasia sp. SYSU D00948 TaxID=2817379 RepID=UPI001B30DA27|nr:MerR family transcriptional regulator [Naasia sp. SYSU D00948]
MRISELSRRSGVSAASIKYYVREGLLPAGESTGPTASVYGDEHVRRLRIIRALIEVGGLSIATARDVLGAVDSPDLSLPHVFERAQVAVSRTDLYMRESSDPARIRVDELVNQRGWHVHPGNPGRTALANVLDTLADLGHPELQDLLEPYADAAVIVAEADLRAVAAQPDIEGMTETVVAGTVLGDAMLAALRRICQEHMTSLVFPSDGPDTARPSRPDDRSTP